MNEFHRMLYVFDLGHMYEWFLTHGIKSIKDLINKNLARLFKFENVEPVDIEKIQKMIEIAYDSIENVKKDAKRKDCALTSIFNYGKSIFNQFNLISRFVMNEVMRSNDNVQDDIFEEDLFVCKEKMDINIIFGDFLIERGQTQNIQEFEYQGNVVKTFFSNKSDQRTLMNKNLKISNPDRINSKPRFLKSDKITKREIIVKYGSEIKKPFKNGYILLKRKDLYLIYNSEKNFMQRYLKKRTFNTRKKPRSLELIKRSWWKNAKKRIVHADIQKFSLHSDRFQELSKARLKKCRQKLTYFQPMALKRYSIHLNSISEPRLLIQNVFKNNNKFFCKENQYTNNLVSLKKNLNFQNHKYLIENHFESLETYYIEKKFNLLFIQIENCSTLIFFDNYYMNKCRSHSDLCKKGLRYCTDSKFRFSNKKTLKCTINKEVLTENHPYYSSLASISDENKYKRKFFYNDHLKSSRINSRCHSDIKRRNEIFYLFLKSKNKMLHIYQFNKYLEIESLLLNPSCLFSKFMVQNLLYIQHLQEIIKIPNFAYNLYFNEMVILMILKFKNSSFNTNIKIYNESKTFQAKHYIFFNISENQNQSFKHTYSTLKNAIQNKSLIPKRYKKFFRLDPFKDSNRILKFHRIYNLKFKWWFFQGNHKSVFSKELYIFMCVLENFFQPKLLPSRNGSFYNRILKIIFKTHPSSSKTIIYIIIYNHQHISRIFFQLLMGFYSESPVFFENKKTNILGAIERNLKMNKKMRKNIQVSSFCYDFVILKFLEEKILMKISLKCDNIIFKNLLSHFSSVYRILDSHSVQIDLKNLSNGFKIKDFVCIKTARIDQKVSLKLCSKCFELTSDKPFFCESILHDFTKNIIVHIKNCKINSDDLKKNVGKPKNMNTELSLPKISIKFYNGLDNFIFLNKETFLLSKSFLYRKILNKIYNDVSSFDCYSLERIYKSGFMCIKSHILAEYNTTVFFRILKLEIENEENTSKLCGGNEIRSIFYAFFDKFSSSRIKKTMYSKKNLHFRKKRTILDSKTRTTSEKSFKRSCIISKSILTKKKYTKSKNININNYIHKPKILYQTENRNEKDSKEKGFKTVENSKNIFVDFLKNKKMLFIRKLRKFASFLNPFQKYENSNQSNAFVILNNQSDSHHKTSEGHRFVPKLKNDDVFRCEKHSDLFLKAFPIMNSLKTRYSEKKERFSLRNNSKIFNSSYSENYFIKPNSYSETDIKTYRIQKMYSNRIQSSFLKSPIKIHQNINFSHISSPKPIHYLTKSKKISFERKQSIHNQRKMNDFGFMKKKLKIHNSEHKNFGLENQNNHKYPGVNVSNKIKYYENLENKKSIKYEQLNGSFKLEVGTEFSKKNTFGNGNILKITQNDFCKPLINNNRKNKLRFSNDSNLYKKSKKRLNLYEKNKKVDFNERKNQKTIDKVLCRSNVLFLENNSDLKKQPVFLSQNKNTIDKKPYRSNVLFLENNSDLKKQPVFSSQKRNSIDKKPYRSNVLFLENNSDLKKQPVFLSQNKNTIDKKPYRSNVLFLENNSDLKKQPVFSSQKRNSIDKKPYRSNEQFLENNSDLKKQHVFSSQKRNSIDKVPYRSNELFFNKKTVIENNDGFAKVRIFESEKSKMREKLKSKNFFTVILLKQCEYFEEESVSKYTFSDAKYLKDSPYSNKILKNFSEQIQFLETEKLGDEKFKKDLHFVPKNMKKFNKNLTKNHCLKKSSFLVFDSTKQNSVLSEFLIKSKKLSGCCVKRKIQDKNFLYRNNKKMAKTSKIGKTSIQTEDVFFTLADLNLYLKEKNDYNQNYFPACKTLKIERNDDSKMENTLLLKKKYEQDTEKIYKVFDGLLKNYNELYISRFKRLYHLQNVSKSSKTKLLNENTLSNIVRANKTNCGRRYYSQNTISGCYLHNHCDIDDFWSSDLDSSIIFLTRDEIKEILRIEETSCMVLKKGKIEKMKTKNTLSEREKHKINDLVLRRNLKIIPNFYEYYIKHILLFKERTDVISLLFRNQTYEILLIGRISNNDCLIPIHPKVLSKNNIKSSFYPKLDISIEKLNENRISSKIIDSMVAILFRRYHCLLFLKTQIPLEDLFWHLSKYESLIHKIVFLNITTNEFFAISIFDIFLKIQFLLNILHQKNENNSTPCLLKATISLNKKYKNPLYNIKTAQKYLNLMITSYIWDGRYFHDYCFNKTQSNFSAIQTHKILFFSTPHIQKAKKWTSEVKKAFYNAKKSLEDSCKPKMNLLYESKPCCLRSFSVIYIQNGASYYIFPIRIKKKINLYTFLMSIDNLHGPLKTLYQNNLIKMAIKLPFLPQKSFLKRNSYSKYPFPDQTLFTGFNSVMSTAVSHRNDLETQRLQICYLKNLYAGTNLKFKKNHIFDSYIAWPECQNLHVHSELINQKKLWKHLVVNFSNKIKNTGFDFQSQGCNVSQRYRVGLNVGTGLRQLQESMEPSAVASKSSKNIDTQRKTFEDTAKNLHINKPDKSFASRISVFVRKRPMFTAGKDVVDVKSDTISVAELKSRVDLTKYVEQHNYAFDKTFDENVKNSEIFEYVKGMVSHVAQGGTGSVIAYGQTGTGKTHTMFHPSNGLVFLTLEKWLQTKKSGFISFIEIYNSNVYDLLDCREKIELRERSDKIFFTNIVESEFTTLQEATDIVNNGMIARRKGTTSANNESSRSHAILRISSASKDFSTDGNCLMLVDLAGCERGHDRRLGSRLTKLEGAEINKSLLTLKECIRNAETSRYMPFRQSKLTQILKAALIGKAKTVLIATINPASNSIEHTLNTLKYASRIREIQNKHQSDKNRSNSQNQSQNNIHSTNDPMQSRNAEIFKEFLTNQNTRYNSKFMFDSNFRKGVSQEDMDLLNAIDKNSADKSTIEMLNKKIETLAKKIIKDTENFTDIQSLRKTCDLLKFVEKKLFHMKFN